MAALNAHLEQCAECRRLRNQYDLVGEHIRALPKTEPAPEAYSRLMRALAAEHTQFIQNNPASAMSHPIPSFLSPYIQEQTQRTQPADPIVAFASATTGPLPVITTPVRRRRSTQKFSHLGIVGLAAAFLMVIMMGGLTSLLMLARHGSVIPSGGSFVYINFAQVSPTSYQTNTSYPHVASVLADTSTIYYTAYNNNGDWMLEAADLANNKTTTSTPLLHTAVKDPLIVLSSNANWLLWLDYQLPKITHPGTDSLTTNSQGPRSWILYMAQIQPPEVPTQQNTQTAVNPTPTLGRIQTLVSGKFDQTKVPDWVHKPIQGVWQNQNSMLVALVDEQGHSHLDQFTLDNNKIDKKELSSEKNGHILTSPTASNDNSKIFWSEEWKTTEDNQLHSVIWLQETQAATPEHGRWLPHEETHTYLFRDDTQSFQPQIINDVLFYISTNPYTGTDGDQATPTPAQTPQATVTTKATSTAKQPAAIPPVDPAVYPVQENEVLAGKLVAFSLNDYTDVSTRLDATNQAFAAQAGGRFLLWQNSDSSFGMYDTETKAPVQVGSSIPKNTTFLAVNGGNAVWVVNPTTDTGNAQEEATSTVTFRMIQLTTKTHKVKTPAP